MSFIPEEVLVDHHIDRLIVDFAFVQNRVDLGHKESPFEIEFVQLQHKRRSTEPLPRVGLVTLESVTSLLDAQPTQLVIQVIRFSTRVSDRLQDLKSPPNAGVSVVDGCFVHSLSKLE
ncbi:hypothetical protein DSM3645_28882 [Blastopirellula marina DSM 3645]|uniref:Uncharacterized protein n=1 Tax=Blastopirellula marina DSM 3645 TaxID=314230 RepID=A3ZPJ8_9BACT|nr:hypothetical protein DSM3645_28882 [Blastopirellula marina DSM 3645]